MILHVVEYSHKAQDARQDRRQHPVEAAYPRMQMPPKSPTPPPDDPLRRNEEEKGAAGGEKVSEREAALRRLKAWEATRKRKSDDR